LVQVVSNSWLNVHHSRMMSMVPRANFVLAGVQDQKRRMDETFATWDAKLQGEGDADTECPEDSDQDEGFSSDEEELKEPSKNADHRALQRGLLSSKVVQRALRNATKLMENNMRNLPEDELPPLPMDCLRKMAKDRKMLRDEMQKNPTIFYEVYSWCQRMVTVVYDAMKSVMESAIRRMHVLACAMSDKVADLRDLEIFKNDIIGVMGKFLSMANDMKSKLLHLKDDLMKLTKNTGIVELKKGRDAIVLQHRLHEMMMSLKRVREEFLRGIRSQWHDLEKQHHEAIQKQVAEIDAQKKEKPTLVSALSNKGFLGALLAGGGILVIGVLVVGLLAGLSVIAGPLLVGIAAGFAVFGSGAATFGAVVGRNMQEAEGHLKEKFQDVCAITKDIGITLGAMKNSIDMVADSLDTLADSFAILTDKITNQLQQFATIEARVKELSVDDWCDVVKVRNLKAALTEDDAMEDMDGDPVVINVSLMIQEMDNTINAIDQLVGEIGRQTIRLRQ